MKFDYSRNYSAIDFRRHPELYQIGRGEQGVLLVEPYKSELLPLWRFRTPQLARQSAEAIYQKFLFYRRELDFVGMDMSRKYLQMGYTRARRYANHKGGRKYAADGHTVLPYAHDADKALAATFFYEKWRLVRQDEAYVQAMKQHKRKERTQRVPNI